MRRITNDILEKKVNYLNRITGNATEPYTKDDSGRYRANVGNYHVSGAYGGVALHQMQTDDGGVRDVFSTGHITKRELAYLIDAYAQGISESAD